MAGIDEYTKLMLHMNGPNGSPTFTDDSNSAHTMTAHDNAQIDTAQYKFGGASGLFDGSDYVTAPYSTDFVFGSGAFTVDGWVYPTSMSGAARIIGIGVETANGLFTFGYGDLPAWGGGGTRLNVATRNSDNSGFNDYSSSIITMATNQWHHLAAVRTGNTLLLFFNGTQVASLSFTTTLAASGSLCIGARFKSDESNLREYVTGNLDEMRISKGIARWTSDFTPPSDEYTVPVPRPYMLNRRATPINKIPNDVLVW